MKVISLNGIALAVLGACSNGDRTDTPAATASSGSEVHQPTSDAPDQGDGTPAADLQKSSPGAELAAADSEALGVLSAINQHEIDAARQAQQRTLPPALSDYAEMMIKDHTDNQNQIQAIGTPGDSEAKRAQEAKGQADLAALGEHKQDYAKAYVDAMVKGHTEALKTIDDKLLAKAQSPQARQHLEKTRTAVAGHLEKAKAIQSSL